jgi:amino acid adenylation domain-containing protein
MTFELPRRSAAETIPFSNDTFKGAIPARFEEIVRQLSDHVAIKTDRVTFSYTHLNSIVNRLARTIVERRGVEPEAVGILVDRGSAPAAAMLAVLKAGKYFVPLDPSFPKARLATTLQHAEAKLLITDRHNIALARDIAHHVDVIEFESVNPLTSDGDLHLTIRPQSLAAIVYTSGSTGEAKGVVLDHRALLHNSMRQGMVVNVDIHDRVTLLTAGTANAVSLTLFTLLNGATLFPFDVAKEGVSRMSEWLARERISVALVPSPLFRRFCASLGTNEGFPDVRVLRLTSESVYKSDLHLYKRHFSADCTFINGLNATEMGPVTACTMDHETVLEDNDVPVGYGLPGMQTLVLDDAGRPLGFNEVGEIAIKSRYLSRGYWRRPDLTEEKFKQDPGNPEEVVYRTGDLGLLLPDGRLVHKGRKDFRIKIRGHGVDIVEVQQQLLSHPDVAEALVVPQKNEMGEHELIAYFTSPLHLAPSVSTLRRFLKHRLAAHMIPSRYVRLNALPLTPNGKINRAALPPAEAAVATGDGSHAAPHSATEAKLQRIWVRVLKVHPIGTTDDFFDLGGDSLAAVELVAAVETEFDVSLAPGILVQAPTIQKLAARVATERDHQRGPHPYLVELQSGIGRTPIFFVPGGVGGDDELFVYTRLARHVGNYPFYCFKARSSDGTTSSQSTVAEMAADYIAAMQAVHPHGPYYLIGECSGGIVAFEIAQQLHARGFEPALLLLMDTTRPDRSLEFRRRLTRRFKPILNGRHVTGIKFLWDQLRRRTISEKVRYLLEKKHKIVNETLRRDRGPFTEPVDPRIEYVQRSYSRAIYAYRPKVYPGRMTLLVHDEFRREDDRATLGWRNFVAGGIELHVLPGSHQTYIRDHVEVAAARVRECIERAAATAAAAPALEPALRGQLGVRR